MNSLIINKLHNPTDELKDFIKSSDDILITYVLELGYGVLQTINKLHNAQSVELATNPVVESSVCDTASVGVAAHAQSVELASKSVAEPSVYDTVSVGVAAHAQSVDLESKTVAEPPVCDTSSIEVAAPAQSVELVTKQVVDPLVCDTASVGVAAHAQSVELATKTAPKPPVCDTATVEVAAHVQSVELATKPVVEPPVRDTVTVEVAAHVQSVELATKPVVEPPVRDTATVEVTAHAQSVELATKPVVEPPVHDTATVEVAAHAQSVELATKQVAESSVCDTVTVEVTAHAQSVELASKSVAEPSVCDTTPVEVAVHAQSAELVTKTVSEPPVCNTATVDVADTNIVQIRSTRLQVVEPTTIPNSKIGKLGENYVKDILVEYFGSNVSCVANNVHSGDLSLVINNFKICIEVKNYTKNIPIAEVNKFISDIESTQSHGGVFISLKTPIMLENEKVTQFAFKNRNAFIVSTDENMILLAVKLVMQSIQNDQIIHSEIYSKDIVRAQSQLMLENLDKLYKARHILQKKIGDAMGMLIDASAEIASAEMMLRYNMDVLKNELWKYESQGIVDHSLESIANWSNQSPIMKSRVMQLINIINGAFVKPLPVDNQVVAAPTPAKIIKKGRSKTTTAQQPSETVAVVSTINTTILDTPTWKFYARKCQHIRTSIGFNVLASSCQIYIPMIYISSEVLLKISDKNIEISDRVLYIGITDATYPDITEIVKSIACTSVAV